MIVVFIVAAAEFPTVSAVSLKIQICLLAEQITSSAGALAHILYGAKT